MLDKASILQYMQTSLSQPISEKDLLKRMHVDSDHRHEFKKYLNELIASGDVVQLKKSKIGLPEHFNLAIGHVQANRRGLPLSSPNSKISATFLSVLTILAEPFMVILWSCGCGARRAENSRKVRWRKFSSAVKRG